MNGFPGLCTIRVAFYNKDFPNGRFQIITLGDCSYLNIYPYLKLNSRPEMANEGVRCSINVMLLVVH